MRVTRDPAPSGRCVSLRPMRIAAWRMGSRRERRRASHPYAFVLVLIAVTYVWIVAAPEEGWAAAVLILIEATTLVLTIWASGLAWYRPAALVVFVGAVVALLELLVGGTTVRGFDSLLNLGLVFASVVVIAFGVVDQDEINRQSVTGAVCIYLFLGFVFTFLYGACASFGSGPFFAQGTDGTPGTRIYFSYVTIATLGYGDYSPAGQPGRSFAISEALLGQLYLVTVVALLVGRLGLRPRERPESRRDETEAGTARGAPAQRREKLEEQPAKPPAPRRHDGEPIDSRGSRRAPPRVQPQVEQQREHCGF